jgi:hypothetical protein
VRIEGKHVTVKSEDGEVMLDDLSFSFATGEIAVLATDDLEKATAFAMAATGRLRKYSGTVSIVSDQGAESKSVMGLRRIRELTAVPFVPEVGEPDGYLRAWRVLKEEFLFAGKAASRREVLACLAEAGAATASPLGQAGPAALARMRLKDVDPVTRIRLFTQLAAARPGVRFVFVTVPERYGGLPGDWFKQVEATGTEANAVIVITTRAAAHLLARPYLDIDHGMRPREPRPGVPEAAP